MAKSRRANLVGLAATATLLLMIATLIYWSFIRPSIGAPKNRRALTAFASAVRIGDSQVSIRETFETSLGSSSIRFVEYDSDCWAFKTPLEFGSGNWILVVSFDNGNVDGVGFRTADSLKGKPGNAPADRVLESSRSRWKNRFGPIWES